MKNSISILAIATIVLLSSSAMARDKVVVIPLFGQEPTGDAFAADVLEGKTFSNKDTIGVTGTMVIKGAVTITPGATAIPIPEGYHDGSGSVETDGNLLPENIKLGISIFGVNGSFAPRISCGTEPAPFCMVLLGALPPPGALWTLYTIECLFEMQDCLVNNTQQVCDEFQAACVIVKNY